MSRVHSHQHSCIRLPLTANLQCRVREVMLRLLSWPYPAHDRNMACFTFKMRSDWYYTAVCSPCSDPRACGPSAQEDLKARRRMLGNIQFIGELFKEKMLTEKIMHECIVKLLGEASAVCPSASSSAALRRCLCPMRLAVLLWLFSIITNGLVAAQPKQSRQHSAMLSFFCCSFAVSRLRLQHVS